MHDPVEELRRSRPTADAWADSPDGRRVRDLALVRAAEARTAKTSPAPHRRRTATAVVAAAVVVGLSAFTYVTYVRGDAPPREVGCYERLDPQSDTTGLLSDQVSRIGAERACVEVWATLEERPADISNPVVCVNDAGGTGVFPAAPGVAAGTACGQIGWRPRA